MDHPQDLSHLPVLAASHLMVMFWLLSHMFCNFGGIVLFLQQSVSELLSFPQ